MLQNKIGSVLDWLVLSRLIYNKYPFIKGPLRIYREMAFCFQNCSGDQEKLLKFEAEGRKFAAILRSLEQFI